MKIIFTIILLGIFLCGCSQKPASEADIYASLLAQTPLGSSRDEVLASNKQHGWVEPGSKALSFMYGSTNKDFGRVDIRLHDKLSPTMTVLGAWEFDRSNRLTRIYVDTHWANLPK